MKLDQQCTSLEISKKLKELGVKQESLFIWVDEGFGKEPFISDRHHGYASSLSAFTVAELGEIIKKIPNEAINKLPSNFMTDDEVFKGNLFKANFWAEMLIYLLENNLITL